MDDQLYKAAVLSVQEYQLIVSAVGIGGVILSIYLGFRGQITAINNQWAQEFYKQKMNIFVKASEAAARVAYLKTNKSDSLDLKQQILNFNVLYGGPMAIHEKPDVEAAMVKFGNGIKMNFESESLQLLALYLSHVLRNEARSLFIAEKESTSQYGTNKELLKLMDEILDKN